MCNHNECNCKHHTLEDSYKEVLEDLLNNGPGLFKGIYDATNGTKKYMYGIESLLEFIAYKTGDESVYEEVDKMFVENLIESERRAFLEKTNKSNKNNKKKKDKK